MVQRSIRRWAMLLPVVGLAALFHHQAMACSRILWNSNGKVVVIGRTWDWDKDLDSRIVVHPRGEQMNGGVEGNAAQWTSKYGSVGVSEYALVSKKDRPSDEIVAGMNEKGLCADLLYLDDTIYEERDKRPGISYMMWCKYVLDNFATVAEAVEGMKDVQIVSVKLSDESVFPAHIAIADPTGDSAIFEFIKGRLVVYHGREHTVMTNEPPYSVQMQNLKRYKGFGGVEEMLPGGIEPGDRFVRGAFYLKHLPAPKDGAQAVAYMWGIVRNISAPFGAPYRSGPATGTYPTWWGTVVDLTNGIFYFDMICSYNQNILRVDLKGLDFSAGTPVRVLDPKDPSLVGDVGQQFKPERKGE